MHIDKEFEMLLEENLECELTNFFSTFDLISSIVRKKLELLQSTHVPVIAPNTSQSTPRPQSLIGAALNKANPLKKEKQPSWIPIATLSGHRDGVWDVCSCLWDKYYVATASAG